MAPSATLTISGFCTARVRVWVVAGPGQGSQASGLHRVLVLTPYALEILAEDVARLGAGDAVDVLLDPGAPRATVGAVEAVYRPARRRGVRVTVRCRPSKGERAPAPFQYGVTAVQRA